MKTIERKIEEYIRDNGIKKVFIYKGLGMSRTTLGDKLRGKIEFKTGEFVNLCKLLRCDPSTFINDDKEAQ